MGKAAAIPAHLYEYAESCTDGAEQVQRWVRAALSPAFATYRAGGGRVPAIDHEIAVAVAKTYYTDRDVHTVGRLFWVAGSAGALPSARLAPLARPAPDANGLVTTTDEALNQRSAALGAQLARTLVSSPGGSESPELWGEINLRLDDPSFAAGFANALSHEELAKVFSNPTIQRLLVSAYAGGLLSRDAKNNIALVLRYDSPDPNFLRLLRDNPAAAANFARYLMTHPKVTADLLKFPVHDDARGGDGEFQRQLLATLTAAIPALGPQEVRTLLDKVAHALPERDLPQDLERGHTLEPYLANLLTAAATKLLPQPTPAPGQSDLQVLQQWAAKYGAQLWTMMAPYEKWVTGLYTDEAEARAHRRAFVENFVLGAAGAVLTGGLGTAAVIAASGVYGGVAGEVQPPLDKALGGIFGWSDDPDHPANDPQNYLRKIAIVAVVGKAFEQGKIGGPGQPQTLEELVHDPRYGPGFRQLLSSVEQGRPPSGSDTSWAYGLKVDGGGNLGAVLDALRLRMQPDVPSD